MLSVPLPFLAGLVFALTLHRSLKGVEVTGTRLYFHAFLVLYALQGVGVGLRFGYGVNGLSGVLPISASLMPPLAYLAFRTLTGERLGTPWLHLLAPVAVTSAVIFIRDLVDPLLLAIFLAYGVALWRLTTGGGEAMAEASLQRMGPAFRAARLTAGLMLFFAVSDAALAAYTALYGAGEVPLAVTMMNLAALAAVLAYYFAPDVSAPDYPAGPAVAPTRQDRAVLAQVEAALEDRELYKSEDLSLARLARKVGLPARDVSAAVNRATGLNVSQFVNNRRILEASRLLDTTEKPVTAIMFDAGFSTKSNFNREFRRVTGMSPGQYRVMSKTGPVRSRGKEGP